MTSRAFLRAGVAALALGVLVAFPARAPADILEQRRRLPPAATCGDSIAGTWRAHQYYPNHGQWLRITVVVAREGGSATELVGTTTTEYWEADATNEQPPPCRPGLVHRTVTGTLEGRLEGSRLEWWATAAGEETVHCGPPLNQYERGRSVGTLEPGGQEFRAIFDTGESWREEPTLYRRIACGDGTPIATPVVAPVPVPPPAARGCGGCAC